MAAVRPEREVLETKPVVVMTETRLKVEERSASPRGMSLMTMRMTSGPAKAPRRRPEQHHLRSRQRWKRLGRKMRM